MDKPPKPHSVIIIGAGMSGLCMGIELRRRGIEDFLILEKSPAVGGTWHDNHYPGCCCDVPSVLYSYSFEPNPAWSRRYSPFDEIQAYFEHCADKYGLRPHLRLETGVESAAYREAEGVWELVLDDGERVRARCLVSGLGQLNLPNIPDLPGRDSFGGDSWHSARWRDDVDLAGKRVAVIGNAASALQFIPHLARKAEQLYVYQRHANHVIPRNDRAYSEAEKARFARYPVWQKLHRLLIYLRQDWLLYPLMWRRSPLRGLVARWARGFLEKQVSDPGLRAALWPDYPMGCKRILVSDDYFPTFNRDNVELVTAPIEGIGPAGVATADGVERPVDVLIYGTGFRSTELLSAVRFVGAGGLELAQAWRDGPEAYRGVCTAGFPNFFMLYGPNTNLGHNSIIYMVEQQVAYVARCIDKLLSHGLRSLVVRADVQRAYNDRLQGELADTVWVAGCDNWYKNAAGKVTNNWPHSTLAYRWHMRAPDFSDFEMRT